MADDTSFCSDSLERRINIILNIKIFSITNTFDGAMMLCVGKNLTSAHDFGFHR